MSSLQILWVITQRDWEIATKQIINVLLFSCKIFVPSLALGGGKMTPNSYSEKIIINESLSKQHVVSNGILWRFNKAIELYFLNMSEEKTVCLLTFIWYQYSVKLELSESELLFGFISLKKVRKSRHSEQELKNQTCYIKQSLLRKSKSYYLWKLP